MIRLFASLIVIALVIGGIVWIVDRPGVVRLEWLGWRIDTTMPVLLLAVFLLTVLVYWLGRLIAGLLGLPAWLRARRTGNRRREALHALALGQAALLTGDHGRARRMARKVESLTGDANLALPLSASVARAQGDAEEEARTNAALLAKPETELAGMRGLMETALRLGKTDEALSLAEKALERDGSLTWAARAALRLHCRAHHWEAAERTLNRGIRDGALAPEEGIKLRPSLAIARSAQAMLERKPEEAQAHATHAVDAAPSFVPAIVALGEAWIARERPKRAVTLVEESWAKAPHPELARLYFQAQPDIEDPLRRVRLAERLAGFAPGHVESRLVVAEKALEAKLWGQARAALKPDELGRDARVFWLLARIEEEETGDLVAANRWLRKAATAEHPYWGCQSCGARHPAWTAACPACEEVGTLAWHAPMPALPTAVAPAGPAKPPATTTPAAAA